MPKCFICDKNLTEVLIDGRDLKPRPCSECEEIIQSCLQEQQEDAIYAYVESELVEFDEELRDYDDPDDCEINLGDA